MPKIPTRTKNPMHIICAFSNNVFTYILTMRKASHAVVKVKKQKNKILENSKMFLQFFFSITIKTKNILTEIIPIYLRYFNTIGFMKGKYNFRLFTAYTVQQIVIGFFEAAEPLCWKKKKKTGCYDSKQSNQ